MRISVIAFLTITTLTATSFGSETYAQRHQLSLELNNITLKEAFREIEKNSDYVIFYYEGNIQSEKKVSLSVKDEPVDVVLQELLKGSGNSFHIEDKQIYITHKKAEKRNSPLPDTGLPQQQRKIVMGKVVDSHGEELTGAAVIVEGSTRGVTTDLDGTFSIEVTPEDKLVVSFLGMETQTVPVGNNTNIVITLRDKADLLDEVTVVAFAKQKKESVVAAITTVDVSELKVPSSNLTTAFAGRIAGIISYQRSGEPGLDNAEFFVRGITTFGEGRNPLILIDGVELGTEDLARLNPDDIATFSVMKDAAASALYGARGANGVIYVTTKEGQEGKAKLSIRYESSFSAPTHKIKLADPITYMKLHNEAVRTRNGLTAVPYSNEKIERTQKGGNPYAFPATDWYDLMFKDITHNQRLNLSISGGGTVARYYVAATYNQDNGNLKMDKRNNFNNNIDLKKYLLRSNVNINVTKSTELIVRLHGTFDDYTGPVDGGASLYNKVMRTNPVLYPAYYEPDLKNEYTEHILFGNYGSGNYLNPYADMVRGYKDYSKTLVLAQVELKQDLDFLVKGLSLRAMFNTTRYSFFDVSRYYNPFFYEMAGYDKYTDKYVLNLLNEGTGTDYLNYNEGTKVVESTTYFEAAAQYNQTFGKKHSVGGLLVFTSRERLAGNAGSLQLSLPARNMGLAGRFTYGYDSRYFIEANFGYNGSERFAKKERFGFFPSAGIGYLISNEKFWEPIDPVVSKLKLKATYGMVGNDKIGKDTDRFFYLSEVNMNDGGRNMVFGSDFGYSKNGVSISRYADPYITWETSYKQNYGIEVELLNKLEIQADYFIEHRKKILQKREDIPTTMGLQAKPQANIGEAYGTGFEVSVDYNQSFSKDMWLTARGNFTYATSEYRVYEEPDYPSAPWRSRVGQSLNQEWGLVAERLFIDEEDVKNSPRQVYGDYMAGDIKYKDINMDGVIDDQDRVAIGFPVSPEIIYGFGFSFGYKNLDVSAFFQGSARSSFWLDVNSIAPFVDPTSNNGVAEQNALLQSIVNDHWAEDNRNPSAFWPRLADSHINNNKQQSTWFMREGSFLRLKSAEIGYSIPRQITSRVHLGPVRVYLSGTNLLCFSKFKLWDPEMSGNGLGYPVQRVFNIGINVNL